MKQNISLQIKNRINGYEDGNIFYEFDGHLCTEAAGCFIRLEFLKIRNGMLVLEGTVANLEPDLKSFMAVEAEEEAAIPDEMKFWFRI